METSRLTRDGTTEPVWRDQILRRERGQGNMNFLCSADHEQDWHQPYPVDPYSRYMCDHTYYSGGISVKVMIVGRARLPTPRTTVDEVYQLQTVNIVFLCT